MIGNDAAYQEAVGRFEGDGTERGGIRTPGTVPRTLVFETSSISHSDTSPGSAARRGATKALLIHPVGEDGGGA